MQEYFIPFKTESEKKLKKRRFDNSFTLEGATGMEDDKQEK